MAMSAKKQNEAIEKLEKLRNMAREAMIDMTLPGEANPQCERAQL
jgi:hypothetical protein